MFEKAGMSNMKINGVSILSLLITVILVLGVVFVGGCDEEAMEGAKKTYLPKAVEIIRAGLADEDPVVRSNAIEAVASAKYVKLMAEVQKLMADDYVMVRFAAILAVGDVGYKPAEKMLKQLLEVKEQNTRIAAAYAMTKLGYAGYLDIIRKAAVSDDDTVKSNAAYLLGKAGDKRSLELLYNLINDPDSSDRAQLAAMVAIAKVGDEKIFERLWAKSLSTFADDRVIGIEAMGALGTAKAMDVLITILDDEIFWVRLAAAEQLGRLGSDEGEPEVLQILRGEFYEGLDSRDLERAQVLSCAAIGQLCTPEVMKYLPEFLGNNSKYVRIAASKAVLQCSIGK